MASPQQSPARCSRHPQTETRLSCSACETPICPACMVMTEVGFKCPACIGSIKSHALEVTRGQLILAGGLSLLAGFALGWLLPLFFRLGFFVVLGIPAAGLLLCWLAGRGAGALVHRAVRYKIGVPLKTAVLMGAVTGLVAGPYGMQVLTVLMSAVQASAVSSLSVTAGFLLIRLVSVVLGGLLFLRGMLGAFNPR